MRDILPGRHRDHPRAAIAIYLLGSVVVGAVAASGVSALLALAVGSLDPLAALDQRALGLITDRRGEAWNHAALAVTALGNTLTVAVLLLCIGAVLWGHGRRLPAGVLLISFTAGRLLAEALKAAFGQPRPDTVEWLAHATSMAFPSAHAMSATIAYGGGAYVMARVWTGRAPRIGLWAFATIVVVAVAASRVYLGVHYPSDVLGGILAGVAWSASVMSTLPAAEGVSTGRPSDPAALARGRDPDNI